MKHIYKNNRSSIMRRINYIFYIISQFQAFQKKDNEVEHCSNSRGISVFSVKVHCDTAALIKLRTELSKEFSTDYNTMSAALKFFGGIFDMVNEDLQPYGVQIRGDFSELRTESLGTLPYNQKKCEKQNAVSIRTTLLANKLRITKFGEVGNRILVFYCRNLNDGKDFSVHSVAGCGNISGFAIGNLRNLGNTIRREVVRAISRDQYEIDGLVTSSFNSSLCSQAKKCIPTGGISSIYGEFVNDLKSIRHLAAENYITGKGYRLREHDLYDDVEEIHGSGDPEVHPTQDYSNDNELYEDVENEKSGVGGMLNGLF